MHLAALAANQITHVSLGIMMKKKKVILVGRASQRRSTERLHHPLLLKPLPQVLVQEAWMIILIQPYLLVSVTR